METTKILGIDPGLNITGYAVVEVGGPGFAVIEAGVIRSKRSQDLGQRLSDIHGGLCEVIDRLRPDCVGLEQLYSHYARPTTAIIMGHARGAIVLACAQAGLTVHSYAATQIKKVLTGNGRAPKSQVQLAVASQLNLASVPEPPDVADAAAIAICHHFMNSRPVALQ